MTVCTPSTALLELYEHASKTLPADKLEWLGNLAVHAELDAKNLSSTLAALASSIESVTSWASNEELQNILFGLSNQAALVAAVVYIASDAEETARERKGNSAEQRRQPRSLTE